MVYSKKTTIIIYRQPRIGTMQLFSASGYVPTHAARKRLSIECHQWWLSWHLLVGHIDDVLPLNRVIVILPSYYSNVVLSSCSAPKHHLAALQWNTALHQLRIALPPLCTLRHFSTGLHWLLLLLEHKKAVCSQNGPESPETFN
jgi:hypothetical protein